MLYSENMKITKNGLVFTDKHGNRLGGGLAMTKALIRVQNWFLDFNLFVLHLISLHVPLYFIRKISFKLSGVKIGFGSTIHMGCKFFDPRGVIIGNDTIIGDSAFLDGRAVLKIGNHVDIASEVMIYNSEHDINSPKFLARTGSVEISDYVFIGPRAIILPGVKINRGSIVAAGAVVTHDVSENTIVGGVPAVVIGKRNLKDFNYRLGRARLFQ